MCTPWITCRISKRYSISVQVRSSMPGVMVATVSMMRELVTVKCIFNQKLIMPNKKGRSQMAEMDLEETIRRVVRESLQDKSIFNSLANIIKDTVAGALVAEMKATLDKTPRC
ncbi:hypothetical protein C0J52_21976 [Blattella germanica]|nr:hypothetical protein C0J52_21976 [Blattella germanica]